jgi:ABC-type multidrug transport system fused ATPase/permease subunit
MNHRFLESLQGMRIIKSFSSERFESARIGSAIEDFHSEAARNRTLLFSEIPARHVADAFLVSAALALSYMAFTQGRLQTGGFIMYVGLCMRTIMPVAEFSRQLLQLNRSVGGASRIDEILSYASPLQDGPREAEELGKAIEVKDVSFSYSQDGHPVLDGVNITVGRGETVALVGASGSGKTTLVDLVLRLYDPTGGSILYDGTDIREFKQRPYRKNFGVVAQEPVLFHMSVRENIVYSRADDDDRLQRAIEIANVAEFIPRLPEGLNSIVGDRGVMLSGGQRQRIAIARAVYGEPSILVLDEATSALDSKSELEVQNAIARAVEGLTAVIIAHRLSTIVHADRIVVLNEGRVEAVGRHGELLETSKTYRFLHDLQHGALGAGKGAP